MSALSISPAFDHEVVREVRPARPTLRVVPVAARRAPRPAAPRPTRPARRVPAHVRLTRRGRVLVTLGFLAAALALMVTFGGWATATLTGGTPAPVRVVEVQPGQTLYDIAGEVARPGQVREMVYKIEELNSLPGATIQAGQKLAVPKG